MDGDFQQHYQDAERAYGEGDYAEAHRLASGLLEQLVDQPEDADAQAAVLGWRAFVALLLGHIELYGKDNPQQAAGYYEQVLASQPHDTLAELAQQGLERSRQGSSAASQPEASPAPEPSPAAEPPPEAASQPTRSRQPLPDLLRDPFLKDQPEASAERSAKTTAMPWLESTPNPTPAPTPPPTPEPTPNPTPAPTPPPTPEPTPQPEPEPEPEAEPEQESEPPEEIPILEAELVPEPTVEPTPEPDSVEEDPLQVLAGSLLRVKINWTDSRAEDVPQEPPRPSLIQQLRALVGRR